MEPGKRCCQECGQIHDESAEHFPPGKDGALSVACTSCLEFKRQKRTNSDRKARKKKMQQMERVAVDALLAGAARGGAHIPHSAELLEQIMTYYGGTSGFSALLVKQYFDAPPGSTQRGRILEMCVRLVQKNVDQGGAMKPLSLWSEEELDAELDARFRKALRAEGKILDVQEAEEADAAESDSPPPSESHLPVRIESMEGDSGGDFGSEDRGAEVVSSDSHSGSDAPVQGE
jgi:hypothetical protein